MTLHLINYDFIRKQSFVNETVYIKLKQVKQILFV